MRKYKPGVERVAAGAVPVPLKLTICVPPPMLLSVMVSVPVSGPAAVGEKVTLIVQLAPTLTLLPQLFVWEKFPLVVMLMLVMVRVALPVLVRVTCDALAVPTS